MKERPILFSAPMVRAILDGSKTQTRRVMKIQPDEYVGQLHVDSYNPVIIGRNGEEQPGQEIYGAFNDGGDWGIKSPYGQPGDRLWVRETFLTVDGHRAFYRADYNHNPKGDKEHGIVWTPSIHMPRWASRITLEVTGVRVERLRDISGSDAVAEGVRSRLPDNGVAVAEYRDLWQSINGAGSWEANPWVWVVEFKVLENG